MRRDARMVLGAVLLILLGASTHATAQSGDPAAGLTRLRDRWIDAYQRGDSAAMAGLYEADAVRMPYDAALQQGRLQILAGYGASFRSRARLATIDLVADDVHVLGDAQNRAAWLDLYLKSSEGWRLVVRANTQQEAS